MKKKRVGRPKGEPTKTVRVPVRSLKAARQSVRGTLGNHVNDGQALAACVDACCSGEERLLEHVNAAIFARTIANVTAAFKQLLNVDVQVKVKGRKFWLSLPGKKDDFFLGETAPALVVTELAKLGRKIETVEAIH